MTGSRHHTPVRAVVMQPLERRVLFAAILADGVLTVTGTPGNDAIGGHLWWTGEVQVGINGAVENFPVAAISRVVITAGEGNDNIRWDSYLTDYFEPVPVPFSIDAGPGEDLVRCGPNADTIDAGAGNDSVWGNDGRDKIFGNDGEDYLNGGAQPDAMDGGTGNDRINGNGGHDRLLGGPNADRLFGYDGNDLLEGGSSNDRLEGGLGADTMYGHGQDDRFFSFGDGAADLLFGGSGSDTARVDSSDVLDSVASHVIS